MVRKSTLLAFSALTGMLLAGSAMADDMNQGTTRDLSQETATSDQGMSDAAMANASPASAPAASSFPMISGGVGDDDEMRLAQQQNHYNLKLLFTEGNGMYLSDVQVRITDKNGADVARTITSGPILLIKLPAGQYHVTAISEGVTKEQKVSVDSKLHTFQVRYPTRDTEG